MATGSVSGDGPPLERPGAGASEVKIGRGTDSLPLIDLASPAAGPKRTTSLSSRGAPLASTSEQLRTLAELPIRGRTDAGDFDAALAACGYGVLRPAPIEIFQINVGKLCNMTCRHCHVDAGPDRIAENMDRATIDLCLAALDRTAAHTVDITGGAPELNPHFRDLVEECVARGKHVIDRCNLTILLLPRFTDLPEWLGARGVEVVCSLPHCRKPNTDAQRGEGTFEKSIEALRRLNAAGYGAGDPRRRLTLMTNPAGAYLAGSQPAKEREWKAALKGSWGVVFDRLIALNNMPISRFLEWLLESGTSRKTHGRRRALSPGAIVGAACHRDPFPGTRLFDCDFNQCSTAS